MTIADIVPDANSMSSTAIGPRPDPTSAFLCLLRPRPDMSLPPDEIGAIPPTATGCHPMYRMPMKVRKRSPFTHYEGPHLSMLGPDAFHPATSDGRRPRVSGRRPSRWGRACQRPRTRPKMNSASATITRMMRMVHNMGGAPIWLMTRPQSGRGSACRSLLRPLQTSHAGDDGAARGDAVLAGARAPGGHCVCFGASSGDELSPHGGCVGSLRRPGNDKFQLTPRWVGEQRPEVPFCRRHFSPVPRGPKSSRRPLRRLRAGTRRTWVG